MRTTIIYLNKNYYLIVASFCLWGCALYTPIGPAYTAFTERGQKIIAISVANPSFQVAGAVSNHLAISGQLGMYSIGKLNKRFDYTGNFEGKATIADIGLNYFKKTAQGHNISLGFSMNSGNIRSKLSYAINPILPTVNTEFNAHYNKLSFNPSATYLRKHFEATFCPSVGLLNYSGLQTGASDSMLVASGKKVLFDRPFVLFEPNLTFRAGGSNTKFQMQLIAPINISSVPLSGKSFMAMNLGIIYKFPRR